MKHLLPAALIAASILLFSCGHNDSNSPSEIQERESVEKLNRKMEREEETAGNGLIADTIANPQTSVHKQERNQAPDPPKEDWDKKIIKTASLNVEVKDHSNYYTSLREKVRSVGGYIAQEEQNQSEYKIETTISIKVPVDQFDNAVAQLIEGIETLNEKKISSQDVTTEFIDTKSRMEAKKQVRLRYMDLLKQARNMEDILSVQSEINGIQEEIEAGTGRIAYLSHSAAFSTINLTYYQMLDAAAKNKEDDKPSFAARTGNAFKTGWNFIGELFVGLVSIWPLYLVVFTVIFIYKKWRKQRPKQVA